MTIIRGMNRAGRSMDEELEEVEYRSRTMRRKDRGGRI